MRQFEASAGFFGLGPKFTAKRSYMQVYGLAAAVALPVLVLGGLNAINPHAAQAPGRMVSHVMPVLLVLGLAGWFAYYHLHNNQKIVVSVIGDAITINKRPGDVYAFSDARLGRWAYGDRVMGTRGAALAQRCATVRSRWPRSPRRRGHAPLRVAGHRRRRVVARRPVRRAAGHGRPRQRAGRSSDRPEAQFAVCCFPARCGLSQIR